MDSYTRNWSWWKSIYMRDLAEEGRKCSSEKPGLQRLFDEQNNVSRIFWSAPGCAGGRGKLSIWWIKDFFTATPHHTRATSQRIWRFRWWKQDCITALVGIWQPFVNTDIKISHGQRCFWLAFQMLPEKDNGINYTWVYDQKNVSLGYRPKEEPRFQRLRGSAQTSWRR